jgi:ribosomal protein S18 acetylase RimI-like enzyme
MEYFKKCSLSELKELQRISQSAYAEAFHDLIDNENLNNYINNKYSLDNLQKELEDVLNHFLFFCKGEKAMGYMKYILKPDSLEIERLYMLGSFKGMGVGSKFMNEAENIARLNGKKIMTLGVLKLNKPAYLFYEKRGFTQYSSEVVTIGKSEYPLLLMKKELA